VRIFNITIKQKTSDGLLFYFFVLSMFAAGIAELVQLQFFFDFLFIPFCMIVDTAAFFALKLDQIVLRHIGFKFSAKGHLPAGRQGYVLWRINNNI